MATFLKRLSDKVNWFRSHTLRELHTPHELEISSNTEYYLNLHRRYTRLLKQSVKDDYIEQRKRILLDRAKAKAKAQEVTTNGTS
jgi:hypothetical protein